MKKSLKKVRKHKSETEFRPYRVLFLIVVLSVTCLVLFAALAVNTSA